jgi:ABC-type nickel/cobalt efflux system permease component RcnA
MMAALSILAADGDLDFIRSTAGMEKGSGLVIRDILLILAVVLVLAGVLVIWAKYLRGSGRSHHHHHRRKHRHSSETDTAATADTEPEVESQAAETAGSDPDEAGNHTQPYQHHRQKIHRREHRPRNPTLAETGGLPPVRDEKMPPPVP